MNLDVPPSKLREWNHFIGQIRLDWNGEVPTRIHKHEIDTAGNPEFDDAFVSYIGYLFCQDPTCPECRSERRKLHNRQNPESRTRATRAFNKLRRVAPREFDVVYSVCILGRSLDHMVAQLTRENGVAYTDADALVLLYSGIDKIVHFWRSA